MDTIGLPRFAQWNRLIADWMSTAPRRIEVDSLLEQLQQLGIQHHLQLYCYPDASPPYLVDQNSSALEHLHQSNPLYLEGAYLLDPFYREGISNPTGGVYRLADLSPQAFESSDYFHNLIKPSGIIDELCVLVPAQGALLIISLISLAEQQPITASEQALLTALEPTIQLLLKRWWHDQNPEFQQHAQSLRQQLETALEHFGCSILTERERDILGEMLNGHSIKSLARQLKISTETVKHHRKSIYYKLQISSQSELVELFVQAIKVYDPSRSLDPLEGFIEAPKW